MTEQGCEPESSRSKTKLEPPYHPGLSEIVVNRSLVLERVVPKGVHQFLKKDMSLLSLVSSLPKTKIVVQRNPNLTWSRKAGWHGCTASRISLRLLLCYF